MHVHAHTQSFIVMLEAKHVYVWEKTASRILTICVCLTLRDPVQCKLDNQRHVWCGQPSTVLFWFCVGRTNLFYNANSAIFLQCFDTVGLIIWPVKVVPGMTYNVLSGTLSLYTTLHYSTIFAEVSSNSWNTVYLWCNKINCIVLFTIVLRYVIW